MKKLNIPSIFFILFFCDFVLLPNSIQAQEPILLQVANWGGADEVKLEEEIARKFMEEHPGVQIIFETIPVGYKEKILTRISSGNPPDVFLLDSTILPAFFRHQILIDLMPYVIQMQFDLNQFFPNVLQIAKKDSQLFAIPKDFNPLMMYYNKDLFDRAGIPYPQEGWTWKNFLKICEKLTNDFNEDGQTDQFGTATDSQFYLWQPWLWVNNADILNPNGTQSSDFFNSNASVETVAFLADLKRKYNYTPDVQSLTRSGMLSSLFFTGRVATMVSGHWMVLRIRKYLESGQLNVGAIHIPIPEGGQRTTVMYESGWCVPKGVKNDSLSAELAIFLGNEFAARIRSKSGIAIPAIKKVAEEQYLVDSWGIEEAFYNEIQFCRQPWASLVEDFTKIELIAKDALDAVMNLGKDETQMLDWAAREIDRTLAESLSHQEGGKQNGKNIQIWAFLIGVLVLFLAFLLIFGLVQKKAERRFYFDGIKFLIPSLVLLLIFIITPLLFSLFLSTHQWDIISAKKPFVGLQNYIRLFQDPLFLNALKNTAIFTLQVPVGIIISLLVAMMMNQRLKGVNFLRTLFFLPSVSSFVAIALVWQWLYHPQFGLANFILSKLGMGPFPWLTHPNTALISIMVMTIWMGIGYQMVIFLAGLQGIPGYLYEAARIDGASVWQRFRNVTLPMLMPTTFFVLVTSVIGSFQIFTSIYVMTEGGPARSTDVVVYHIYQNAWEYLRMGEASAMSWVLFVIILGATYFQFKIMGRSVEYG